MTIINQNYSFVLLAISFLSGVHLQLDGYVDIQRSGSQCFHVKGVPTLKLRCPAGELIRIHSAFYGTKLPLHGLEDDATTETVCAYESGQNHCIQLSDMHENCMGRYMCSVYVSNPFLMNCRTFANYMQINYTCVPRFMIHNICDSHSVTTATGYIRTPHYPDANYTSNVHCGCRLSTTDPAIQLYMLDFSVNHTQIDNCDSDYLRIGTWGRKCGMIGPERLPEKLTTDTGSVNLEFHSDSMYSGRGVWLEYRGSRGGSVSRICGPAIPKPRSDNGEVTIQFTDRADIHIDSSVKKNRDDSIEFTSHNLDILEFNKAYDNIIDPSSVMLEFPYQETLGHFGNEYLHKESNANYDNIPTDFIKQDTYAYKGNGESFAGDNGIRNLDNTAIGNNRDEVYKPHDGPWDLPGVNDKSTKNVNMKGDWNNGFVNIDGNFVDATQPGSNTNPSTSTPLDNKTGGRITFEASHDNEKDDNSNLPRLYGIDTVQIITGVFVGVLILIAVIIIIVLVIRRT